MKKENPSSGASPRAHSQYPISQRTHETNIQTGLENRDRVENLGRFQLGGDGKYFNVADSMGVIGIHRRRSTHQNDDLYEGNPLLNKPCLCPLSGSGPITVATVSVSSPLSQSTVPSTSLCTAPSLSNSLVLSPNYVMDCWPPPRLSETIDRKVCRISGRLG